MRAVVTQMIYLTFNKKLYLKKFYGTVWIMWTAHSVEYWTYLDRLEYTLQRQDYQYEKDIGQYEEAKRKINCISNVNLKGLVLQCRGIQKCQFCHKSSKYTLLIKGNSVHFVPAFVFMSWILAAGFKLLCIVHLWEGWNYWMPPWFKYINDGSSTAFCEVKYHKIVCKHVFIS